MNIIIGLKNGDHIPDGAKYLHTEKEPDESKAYYEWRDDPGFHLPFFRTESRYKITPMTTVHYYEIKEPNETKTS